MTRSFEKSLLLRTRGRRTRPKSDPLTFSKPSEGIVNVVTETRQLGTETLTSRLGQFSFTCSMILKRRLLRFIHFVTAETQNHLQPGVPLAMSSSPVLEYCKHPHFSSRPNVGLGSASSYPALRNSLSHSLPPSKSKILSNQICLSASR
jgi:hypothetical protein